MIFNFFKKQNNEKKIVAPKKPKEEKRSGNLAEATRELAASYDRSELKDLYSCSVQKTVKDFEVKEVKLNGQTVNIAFDSLDDEFSDNCSGSLEEAINDVYEMQTAGQEIIYSYYAKQGFIGFNNCAILAQDWLIQKAINAPCEDAIAINYIINCTDSDILSEDKELIQKMQNVSDDIDGFDIRTICKKFAENKRKYGQAICIPLIKDVDYSVPFNIDAVKEKSYKGMVIVEPVWVAPMLDLDATTNPLSKRFYQPTWFKMPDGTMVHHSWCIFGTYGNPSDILKPTYYWGGIPLPQLLYEQTYAAHRTAKEAPMLAMSKRLNYVEVNPNQLLLDREKRKGLKLMSWLRNNFGWLTIEPEQKIGQLDTTLADFDSVVMLSYQVVAAISGVIATRLLETSPKGWQSSGSYEEKQYKNLLMSIQHNDFCPILDLHYRLLAKSEYGISKRYVINFEEIDTPTAKEAAEIREINARTDATYVQAGVVAPEEVREKIREDIDSGYSALEEEMPETETDLFGEEEEKDPNSTGGFFTKERLRENGGSSTEQSFFSVDEEPKDWFTSNGTHIPIENGEGKNEAFHKNINQRRQDEKQSKKETKTEQKEDKNAKTNNTHKNIKDVENKNRNLKYEKGTVFDKDGNIIKEISSGDEGEINLEGENLDYMKGAILTHNHPDGSPISAADIATGFGTADLSELRATNIQGATYSIKPNKDFTKEKAIKFAEEYNKVPFEAAKSFRDLCKKEIQAGTLDIDFLKSNMDNLWKVYAWKEAEKFMEQHASEYGFDYTKE